VPHEVNLVDDPLSDAPLHYRGDFRFEDTDDADALRKEIAQTLTHYCDWWRVGYHRCSHDEDNAESCSVGQIILMARSRTFVFTIGPYHSQKLRRYRKNFKRRRTSLRPFRKTT